MESSPVSRVWSIVTKDRLVLIGVIVAALAVVLSGFLLTRATISGSLLGILAGFGLDPLRGRLVEILVLTVCVCVVGALLSRQRAVVVLGGLAFFSYAYLRGFFAMVMQPVYDPGGLLEPLDAVVLWHTVASMVALAVVAGAIGVALGQGLARVLFDPLMNLFGYIRERWRAGVVRGESAGTNRDINRAVPVFKRLSIMGGLMQGCLLLLALIWASGASNLFVYGPDVNLHLSPDVGGPQGIIINGQYTSRAMGGQRRTFVIYLPPSYYKEGNGRRYPVLYLLHGSPGHQENWLTGGKADQSENTLVQVGRAPEIIMVLPDGNGRGGMTSEWGNSADGKQMLENAIIQDLVPYVDQKYRTLADRTYRGIGGLSMGGFGAANIGVRHPELFGFVITLGGYFYAEGAIWGKDPAYLRANSPAELLPQQKAAWKTNFYVGSATKDGLYQQALSFSQQLKRFHIPYTFDLVPGAHSWAVWQVQLYHSLEWLKTIGV